jgi:hypothetical protein
MFAENLRLSTFTMAILLGAPLTSSLRGMPTQAVANSTLKFFIVHRDRPTAYQHARIIIADESTAHRGTSARQDVDLKGLAKRIGGKVVTSGAEINGSVVPCITVTARGTAVSVYLPAEFPFLAPTVIVRPEGEGDFAFPVGWKLRSSVDLTERLRRLISAAVAHVGNTF